MDWDEWSAYDALGLAELIRKGDVSAAELASQAAQAIALLNPALSAVVEVFDDVVADPLQDGMNPQGAFAGVPFLMKDLGPTLKGRLQEMGSLLMQGNRSQSDSFLVGKMRQAGLNLIGRTTTPEFGVCSSAENPALYITRNPWDPDYTTCGSSAGTAASVAAGMVPMSHATDGGGSIRIPAGFNGNIGLKPSRGVFSIAPYASDLTGLVSIQGCHTRTVRDTAAFVDHCRGGAPGEFMPYWTAAESYCELIQRDPAPLRIALSHEWGDYRATPHFVAELEKTGRFLADLGHHVEWVTPQVDFRAAFAAQTTCYISNFAQTISAMLKNLRLDAPPSDRIEPINIRIWQAGKDISFSERAAMQTVFNNTSRAFGAFFQSWDIILTPITALPTPKIGTMEYLTLSDNPSVTDWFAHLWENFAYTPLSNLCGIPAISLPLAAQENGLPFGIQAQTRQGDDGLLLQLAAQIERAIEGKWNGGRRPGVHVTHAPLAAKTANY
ncbi:amidase [Brenneria nigrifluens]|uniref:Amidase n=2 Tax=Pectobacteriaceae TaxID=1903410 RepID=A0A2U1UNY2_9GAMM|nr:amidase [Brenneria nigrifluens] [Brenneria nigrifluens DSM 30175 = ATCC 13028]QCR06769.1 amidase [Brenneria nigrifluens] [Brenneria nigrifluens DSM 30175 = ATCC 13028]